MRAETDRKEIQQLRQESNATITEASRRADDDCKEIQHLRETFNRVIQRTDHLASSNDTYALSYSRWQEEKPPISSSPTIQPRGRDTTYYQERSGIS